MSYAIHLASNLEIHQALKPNIKRWSENLFEREAFKSNISKNKYIISGGGKIINLRNTSFCLFVTLLNVINFVDRQFISSFALF